MELVTLGNGLGVSLTPRSLAWAIVEDSIITYYLGEEERWNSSIYACLTGLLINLLYLISFLKESCLYIASITANITSTYKVVVFSLRLPKIMRKMKELRRAGFDEHLLFSFI